MRKKLLTENGIRGFFSAVGLRFFEKMYANTLDVSSFFFL